MFDRFYGQSKRLYIKHWPNNLLIFLIFLIFLRPFAGS
ncbi:hypothetical protein BN873_1050004 [Candidatus Competibacter denitrificans Run_A_D11]|uniref:Uncharacterized protein n=1 Tax=Candidatus Competibacter denitrificans Run_A_D11 TaxID=1400863 RepID=W6M5S7_9GAMM|nr:hypothetical protein BN873_1050004 [Candidatus Competibacter denitrificans Run_A_D11]